MAGADAVAEGPPVSRRVEVARVPASSNKTADGAQTQAGKSPDYAEKVTRTPSAPSNASQPGIEAELTQEQQQQLRELKLRDREVHEHEQAHMSAGGQFAGGASYTYKVGPDGKRYAIGGEVPIDVSNVPGDPEATVRKMETVRRAALAPADPSTPDRQIAAQASAAAEQARAQIARQRYERIQAAVASTTQGGDGASAQSVLASPATGKGGGAEGAEVAAVPRARTAPATSVGGSSADEPGLWTRRPSASEVTLGRRVLAQERRADPYRWVG